MNIYENIVILNPSLNEEEVKASIAKICEIISSTNGEILKTDYWGKRKLAYEINKQKMGIYILLLFKAPPSTIKKIEDFFKVHDPIIKFMVIKLSKKQIEAIPKEVFGAGVSSQEANTDIEAKVE